MYIPPAERIGAFAGRVSRPRSMNGRRKMGRTGMMLRMSPHAAALKSIRFPSGSTITPVGNTSAIFRRPHENRRYQSGTLYGWTAGFAGGPTIGVYAAERKKMIAVRRKTITRSRYTSCGQNGIPGCSSARVGPYSRGNPGFPSKTPSRTASISMAPSVGLPHALDPHQGHVQDHQQRPDERQDEHVEPVHPDDIEPRRV